jgi:hypothetical protein
LEQVSIEHGYSVQNWYLCLYSFMPPANKLFSPDFVGPFEDIGSTSHPWHFGWQQQGIRAWRGGELYLLSHF